MSEQYTDPLLSYAPVIDTSTMEIIDKTALITLLRAHRVQTSTVDMPEVKLEDVIPSLRKAKINIPELFFKELAIKLGFTFLDHTQVCKIYSEERRNKLITVLPYQIISKYKVVPLEVNGTVIDLAVDNPFDQRLMVTIRYLFGTWKINLRIISSKSIEWAIENNFREIHKKTAMLGLYNRTPDQSAHKVLYPNQKYFIIALIVAITIAAVINSAATFIALFAIISIGYFIFNPIKIYISICGFRGARTPTRITESEVESTFDEGLPVYTILIPLFRESKLLEKILTNMYRLNYPGNKLDIKILMEEKDQETINEARLLGLFGSPKKFAEGIPKKDYNEFLKLFDPIIIPTEKITTKPRACNYGLLRAKGDLCVIYDAEDNPDPDQLKKAAIVFLRSKEDVVCLQCKLNFYNANENTLTKWFSIEYANWYEFYLQGLDWIDAPIPLGGTSNHFRKKSLDELGRWDPYNVTEDADIGIRLARRDLKTEIIDNYTYEEATISAKSWIKQRSRWYKGHLQTYLVHMRHPRQLLKDLGAEKFFKFQLTFGASVFIPIINPILWIITAASFLLPIDLGWLTPFYMQIICLCNLLVGNLTYLSLYVIACTKLKKYRYIPYALSMPIYWMLHSIASWRGLVQLIRNPFYWDKTNHGLSKITRVTYQ
jgi:cellulose synthase/poly-beta-1,6-N-acetylglucosamine synthase-like glycosyltransferase